MGFTLLLPVVVAIILLAAVVFVRYRRGTAKGPLRFRPVQTSADYDFAPLSQLVRTHLERSGVADAALFLIKDGSVIYGDIIGGYPVNVAQPIASATKWLSTAAIMTLVDEGLLGLDDPVSWYLPQMRDEKSHITMRQLLACTAGFPSRVPWLKSRRSTLAEIVDSIAQTNLIARPGTEFVYGGVGFQVAGRVAEIVTGKPWYRLFRQRIQRPLGMTRTSYGIFARQDDRFYAAQRTNPHIGGGVKSTPIDYGNLLYMILNEGVFEGQQILSRESLRQMQIDQTAGAGITFTAHWNRSARYSLGGWIDKIDDDGVPLHMSSPGAAGWVPWIDLERRYAGILAARCETRKLHRLYVTMTDLIGHILDTGTPGRSAKDAA